MERVFLITASLFGFLSVALGAFAAHGLKGHLSPQQLATFEVGARYQMYHALALAATAFAYAKWPDPLFITGGWLLIVGTLLFSGSLYALSFHSIRWVGLMTPLGGLGLMSGWLCLAWAVWRQ